MKNKILLFSTILLCLAILSCSIESSEINSDVGGNKDSALVNARQWFEGKFLKLENNNLRYSRKISWEYAESKELYKGQKIVAVPVVHFVGNKASLRQLWIYRRQDGELASILVEYINEDPKAKSLSNFTGTMIVRDWGERILFALSYKQDRVTGVLTDDSKSFLLPAGATDRTNTQIQICGPGRRCIPVRVTVPNAIPNAYWSWSCYSLVGCVWVESTQMQNPPQDLLPPPPLFPGTAMPSITDFDFKVLTDPCSGLQDMYQRSIDSQKEFAAVLTTTNKLVRLPTYYNTFTTTFFGDQIKDLNGKILTDLYRDATGTLKLQLYDWSVPNPPGVSEIYNVAALIHTHPCGDPNHPPGVPSDIDNTTASTLRDVKHYIKFCQGYIEYTSTSSTPRSVFPGCAPE